MGKKILEVEDRDLQCLCFVAVRCKAVTLFTNLLLCGHSDYIVWYLDASCFPFKNGVSQIFCLNFFFSMFTKCLLKAICADTGFRNEH